MMRTPEKGALNSQSSKSYLCYTSRRQSEFPQTSCNLGFLLYFCFLKQRFMYAYVVLPVNSSNCMTFCLMQTLQAFPQIHALNIVVN